MENNEFLKVNIKNCTCYYFDSMNQLKYFGIDNILIDKKWHKNVLIYDISYKTLIIPKSLRIRCNKIDGFIRIYDGNRKVIMQSPKTLTPFTIELDILEV